MERKPAKTFADLIVWQKAHKWVLAIYQMSQSFPKEETYGLTSQLRRAAISVPANIAEGFRKRTDGDKIKFMNCSQGSLEECKYYLILIKDLGYAETADVLNQAQEVSKLLDAYVKGIEAGR